MSEPQADATTANAKKKGRSKLLLIGVPVFVLLTGGGGGWWYFKQPTVAADAAPEEAAHEEEAAAGLVPFEPFVVNLADPGGRKYLRVKLVLLVPDEAMAKEAEDTPLTISRLRSSIIDVLTARTAAQINNAEGRSELKKAIAEAANHLGHLNVRDVLFEEFIVQ